jgi:hypothetical protein
MHLCMYVGCITHVREHRRIWWIVGTAVYHVACAWMSMRECVWTEDVSCTMFTCVTHVRTYVYVCLYASICWFARAYTHLVRDDVGPELGGGEAAVQDDGTARRQRRQQPRDQPVAVCVCVCVCVCV